MGVEPKRASATSFAGSQGGCQPIASYVTSASEVDQRSVVAFASSP